jgi:hypothetical protein
MDTRPVETRGRRRSGGVSGIAQLSSQLMMSTWQSRTTFAEETLISSP